MTHLTSNAPLKGTPILVHYNIAVHSLHAHVFDVVLCIAPVEKTLNLALPAWIAGSYMIRDFARFIRYLTVTQGERQLRVVQHDKNTWCVEDIDICSDAAMVCAHYQVYAFDNSVRAAYLDGARAFFNPTSVCLQVKELAHKGHVVSLLADAYPKNWRVATSARRINIDIQDALLIKSALNNDFNMKDVVNHATTAIQMQTKDAPQWRADDFGFGSFYCDHYDELADTPFVLGLFRDLYFKAKDIPHVLIVTGAFEYADLERLTSDTASICETVIDFWHQNIEKAPHNRYVFFLNLVGNGYGGLEHMHSTALIAKRSDLPRKNAGRHDDYVALLGLISHEYFHTWNVKRLKPDNFAQYDYFIENYTQLLWFFEGFTSYYDDLLLYRSGLINEVQYLKLLAKTINLVLQNKGRFVQSVAQASFDAWVKYYRQDENTPNATISYYTKGAMIALCIDLFMRTLPNKTNNSSTLDHLLRNLWSICLKSNENIGIHADLESNLPQNTPRLLTEEIFVKALNDLSHENVWDSTVSSWVHTVQELPFIALLNQMGVEVHELALTCEQRMGFRVQEETGGLRVQMISDGTAACKAGLCVGDEIIAARLVDSPHTWRMRRLSELDALMPTVLGGNSAETVANQGLVLTISRDAVVLTLLVKAHWLIGQASIELKISNEEKVQQWLKSGARAAVG